MLDYTHNQIKDIIKSIAGIEEFSIKPVGNHELNRHLVYVVDFYNKNNSAVFKLYYKKNRRNREMASLNLLSRSSIKCTSIIKCGKLFDGTEWLLNDYLEGEPFEKIKRDITEENQIEIFEDMGRELGKIHSFKTFDFFGNWDEEGRSVDGISECIVNSIISVESGIRDIQMQDLPDRIFFDKAISSIRNNYILLNDIKKSNLCHNDYDGRNILVKKTGDKWILSGVIDFEQSMPGNIEMDIAGLYNRYFLDNKKFEKAFLKGYREYCSLPESFYDRLNFYLLCIGINICSWTYKQAPDYYKQGLKLIMRSL